MQPFMLRNARHSTLVRQPAGACVTVRQHVCGCATGCMQKLCLLHLTHFMLIFVRRLSSCGGVQSGGGESLSLPPTEGTQGSVGVGEAIHQLGSKSSTRMSAEAPVCVVAQRCTLPDGPSSTSSSMPINGLLSGACSTESSNCGWRGSGEVERVRRGAGVTSAAPTTSLCAAAGVT